MIIRILRWAVIALVLSVSARADETVTIRVSAYLSPLSHSVKTIYEPWMERITEASGGRIQFETYWGGSLGRNPYKQYDIVKAGLTEVGLVQPSYSPGQFPQMQVFELPFQMRSSTEASLVAWRLYEKGLLTGFEDVKVLGLWTAEPSNLFTLGDVTSYEEIDGLKIRSAGRLEGDFLMRLGAVPEALHPADAVEALRRTTIDGVVQGWIAINTFQTYRETDYVITAPLGTVTFSLLMNKGVWESLSPDLQKIIEENSGEVIALLGGRGYDKKQREISTRLREEKHLTFIEADADKVSEMQTYVQPIAEAWADRTPGGAETLEAIREILSDLRRRERQS